MIRLTLAAGLLAAVFLPAASMAQPYNGPPPDQGYGSDQDESVQGGGSNQNDNDRGDNAGGDNGYQGDDQDMNDNGGDQDRGDDQGGGGPPPNRAYDRGDSQDNGPQYRPAGGRQHFTGRVGSSWRDANGQDCQWREVSRRDADGYAAYKWVPVCR